MKVTIIGASISGLFLAYLLAREGVEVEVFEKGAVLGWPRRTLIVTHKIEEVLDFVPQEAIINRVKYIALFSKSGSVQLEVHPPDLVIERANLLSLLARLSSQAGAILRLNRPFLGFVHLGHQVMVGLQNLETGEQEHVVSDILVGADGAHSMVSRAASSNGHRPIALVQARVPLPGDANSETVQVWFDPRKTKYFFWSIPESGEMAAVGLIGNEMYRAKSCLNDFLQERKLSPLEYQFATVPMHRIGFVNGISGSTRNVYVIGDAAAQVKMTTVGGVVTGLMGAKALAHTLLKGRHPGKELLGLKHELDLHLLMRYVLNHFEDGDYHKLIMLMDRRLQNVLAKWTRDELKRSFFRLFFAKPQLISLGIKALLRW